MNVLILAIDCLRADRLPNRRSVPPIPALAEYASRGAMFTQAITACVTTTPSFSSLLTGRYPPAHGVFSLHGYRLAPDCPSLVEAFAAAGYHTFAEVTGPLLELIGLNRGFAHYRCRPKDEYLDGSWGEELIARFRDRKYPQPWFGLVHLWELHGPQHVPSRYNHSRNGPTLYDRALAALDEPLSRLLAAVPEDTLIVILGDHGESLSFQDLRPAARLGQRFARRLGRLWEPVLTGKENGAERSKPLPARLARRLMRPWQPATRYQFYRRWKDGHGWHLYDELVRVPLVLVGPRIPAGQMDRLVRTVDILPTLLDGAGVRAPDAGPPLDGRSLLPLLHGAEEAPRSAYLEAAGSCLPDRSFWLRGMRTETHKYTYTPFAEPQIEELYDLTRDPGETRNVVGQYPEIARQLREQCEAIAQAPQRVANEEQMSAEEEEVLADRLRQLGYLE